MERKVSLSITINKKGWALESTFQGIIGRLSYDGYGTHTHKGDIAMNEIMNAFLSKLWIGEKIFLYHIKDWITQYLTNA